MNSVTERYELLEKLRHFAKTYDLSLQEESRPVASALFDRAPLIVNLGFERSLHSESDWYHSIEHPYTSAIAEILDGISNSLPLRKLEFLISPGSDPLTGLQVQLDRKVFSLEQVPSSICDSLETQIIYSFI